MKKVVVFSLFLVIGLTSYAQRFNGGIIAGFSTSQVDGDGYAGYFKPGLVLGAFTNTDINDFLAAQFEIKYAGKGAYQKKKDPPFLYNHQMHYIDFPISLQYVYAKKIILSAGIIPAYVFAEKKEGTSGGQVSDIDDPRPLRKIDFESGLGLGYKLNDQMHIQVNWNYSLIAVRQNNFGAVHYGLMARLFGLNKGDYNNTVQFAMYYRLNK